MAALRSCFSPGALAWPLLSRGAPASWRSPKRALPIGISYFFVQLHGGEANDPSRNAAGRRSVHITCSCTRCRAGVSARLISRASGPCGKAACSSWIINSGAISMTSDCCPVNGNFPSVRNGSRKFRLCFRGRTSSASRMRPIVRNAGFRAPTFFFGQSRELTAHFWRRAPAIARSPYFCESPTKMSSAHSPNRDSRRFPPHCARGAMTETGTFFLSSHHMARNGAVNCEQRVAGLRRGTARATVEKGNPADAGAEESARAIAVISLLHAAEFSTLPALQYLQLVLFAVDFQTRCPPNWKKPIA